MLKTKFVRDDVTSKTSHLREVYRSYFINIRNCVQQYTTYRYTPLANSVRVTLDAICKLFPGAREGQVHFQVTMSTMMSVSKAPVRDATIATRAQVWVKTSRMCAS